MRGFLVAAVAGAVLASPGLAADPADSAKLPAGETAGISERAGYVPNGFTDSKMDSPLLETKNVYDLYATLVDYLTAVYPQEGTSHDALAKFQEFVQREREAYAQDPESARPYRMPMAIDQLMKYLNAGADSGDSPATAAIADNPKAQLYVSSLLPLIHLRGITFRVRPLVERSFVLHTAAINYLRGLKQQLDVMAGANGRAVFNFMTYPMSYSERTPLQFHSPSELQGWLVNSFLPTLDHSISIVEGVVAKLPESYRDSLNMEIFMQAERPFPSESMETAHRWFGKPEVEVYLSQLYAARAALHLLCSYNLDEYSEATNDLTNKLVKGFFTEKVTFGKQPRAGTPAHERFAVLEKYSKLWTLKSAEQCQLALADIRKGVSFFDSGMHGFFQASAGEGDSRLGIIRWFHASFREYEQKLAPQIRAVVAGPATLTDFIGGATIDVDLPGFLSNPPRDLKVFFPAKFDKENKYISLDSAGGKLVYTNYDYGRPLSWKLDSVADGWGRIFPNIKKAVNEQGHWDAPLVTFRDFSRTYIGMIAAPLLAGAIF